MDLTLLEQCENTHKLYDDRSPQEAIIYAMLRIFIRS